MIQGDFRDRRKRLQRSIIPADPDCLDIAHGERLSALKHFARAGDSHFLQPQSHTGGHLATDGDNFARVRLGAVVEGSDRVNPGNQAADAGPELEASMKLDCIGDPCPLPIVNIAQTMRSLKPGQVLEVWADDEGAKADIPAWCMGTGNDFIRREEYGDQMKFLIRKLI